MTALDGGTTRSDSEVGIAELLHLLGRVPGEFTAICTQGSDGLFDARVVPTDFAASHVDSLLGRDTMDIWYSVNPTAGQGSSRRKGRAEDVTRLAGLWADLDVKEGFCASIDVAELIIEKLSVVLGTRPTVLVASGHGLQPIWIFERCDDLTLNTEAKRAAATDLLDQWGALVHLTAAECGAKVDPVFNLDRILRVPGTVNNKAEPVPTRGVRDAGEFLPLDWVRGVLNEYDLAPRGHNRDREMPVDENIVYNELGPEAQARVDGWIREALRGIGAELDDLAGWEPGRRDEDGRGWERRCSDAAYRLGALFRSGWNALTEDAALRVFLDHAPTDGQWTELNLHNKWASQRDRAPAVAFPAVLMVDRLKNAVAVQQGPADRRMVLGSPDDEAFERRVEAELLTLRARNEARRRFDAESAVTDTDFDGEYLSGGQLDDLPVPEPLIEGVLVRHAYGITRGRDATFKSFIVLDWALSMAAGVPWQGRVTERVKVLYIAGEGAYGLASRKRVWEESHSQGVDPSWFVVRKSPVNLYRGGPDLDHLLGYIEENKFGFVVLDTLRKMSGGADGNGSDMGVVVDNIDRIRRATDRGSVHVVAHTGKVDGDVRGFSGIEDDADLVWSVKRKAGSTRVSLTCAKMKDGPDGQTIDLRLRELNGSLVVEHADVATQELATEAESRTPIERIMHAMHEKFADTGASTKDLMRSTGLPQSTTYRVRKELLRNGRLREKAGQLVLGPAEVSGGPS
ncbi:AAA family ATPase [Rhodococcus erythropolis]|uniref:AAA family ATPase n=1 Tax=Rhodococcus erythropolis TaxID=1833 RepID=UPI001BEA9D83|nr:AAA family ATPase [Rhodococcus erythropolis]MBT2269787.1 AAA family ATPase [Rhodococcus erythropolis]